MKQYVIGVDGGGSKTHCALFDIEGNKIDLITWGPTNHEVFKGGFSDMRVEVSNMLSTILDKNNISKEDIVSYAFGLAGVDTKAQHKIISGILEELGCKNFTLCNDAYLGVKAGCKSGVGICAINGTGCTVVGIDSQGGMLQVGGQGTLTGDAGGGGYLGGKALGAVYNSLFKTDIETIMTDVMFSMLRITSKDDYIETLTEKVECGEIKIKHLGKIVFDAANKRDAAALNILKEMGHEYAKSINGAIVNLNFHEAAVIEVVLAGSVFVKGQNPAAIEALKEEVIGENPVREINFKILEEPPVMGAVLWALENSGTRGNLFNKVSKQF
jgi:N-acetylglucosamine kinase-like BadF-type ATPase